MIGEYDIVETKAPAGYAIYKGDDNGKIHMSIRYSDSGDGSLQVYSDEGKGTEDTQHLMHNGSYLIPDEKLPDKPDVFTGFLPMTGRNAVFTVIAVAIMASVVAVLVMRKRD